MLYDVASIHRSRSPLCEDPSRPSSSSCLLPKLKNCCTLHLSLTCIIQLIQHFKTRWLHRNIPVLTSFTSAGESTWLSMPKYFPVSAKRRYSARRSALVPTKRPPFSVQLAISVSASRKIGVRVGLTQGGCNSAFGAMPCPVLLSSLKWSHQFRMRTGRLRRGPSASSCLHMSPWSAHRESDSETPAEPWGFGGTLESLSMWGDHDSWFLGGQKNPLWHSRRFLSLWRE